MLLRLGQLRWVILPDLSVVVPGEEQADGVRRVLRQEILDHDEIAQRFADFSAASYTIAVWNHQRAKGSCLVRHSDWAISLS